MPERVLIVGAGGQLARQLVVQAPAEIECITRPHGALDIADGDALAAVLAAERPSWVINGAAYNWVDKAEGEGMAEALHVNALGVGRLAAACRAAGVRLLHFSTDLVFNGAQRVPYAEDALPRPLGVYGASKLAGEHLALARDPQNLVVRVCRLFGPAPPGRIAQKPVGNFPLLMLHLARTQGRVRVVNDQVGAPTYLPDLARATWELLATPTVRSGAGGLYHLSNAGEIAFADYAHETLQMAGVPCEIESVSTADYGAPARRPLYSTLDNARAHAAGVIPLRHWRDALAEFLTGLI